MELKDFGDHQVLQRSLGSRSRAVRVEAKSLDVTVVTAEAEVVSFAAGENVIVPWTKLGRDEPSLFSGTLEVPQGGWYRLLIRGLDGRAREVARVAGTHGWGVGMNVLCIGQSNMVGHGGTSYTTAFDLAGLYSNDRVWEHLADPYDHGGVSGEVDLDYASSASLVPALANALGEYFPGLPIGIVPAAKGSSPLDCGSATSCWSQRDPVNPANAATLYGNSLAKAREASGVEVIVMHQGETDATNETSTAAYASELARLAANYRADLAPIPLFMCQLGRSLTDVAIKNRTDRTMQDIRVAQRGSDDPPRVYLAATAVDLEVNDTDHYSKAAYDELGRRLAAAIAHHYQVAGAPRSYRGPEVTSVSYVDESRATIDVHLSHRGGSDFTPSDNIEGFAVLDDGAAVEIAASVRQDPTTIRLTLAAPMQGQAVVRYLYGKLPFSSLPRAVHDDSPLALPLEPTAHDFALP